MGYDNTHQAALSALSNPAVSVKIHQLVVTENSDQQWGHSVLWEFRPANWRYLKVRTVNRGCLVAGAFIGMKKRKEVCE